jgi:hypothetical protein
MKRQPGDNRPMRRSHHRPYDRHEIVNDWRPQPMRQRTVRQMSSPTTQHPECRETQELNHNDSATRRDVRFRRNRFAATGHCSRNNDFAASSTGRRWPIAIPRLTWSRLGLSGSTTSRPVNQRRMYGRPGASILAVSPNTHSNFWCCGESPS